MRQQIVTDYYWCRKFQPTKYSQKKIYVQASRRLKGYIRCNGCIDDQWPVEIGEQMAAVHRIYPVLDKAVDLRLVELLRLAEELRTPDRERKRDRLPCTEQDERDGERKHGVPD